MPILRAAFALLNGLVQPMHSVLHLHSAKIYRIEAWLTILYIGDRLDASRREILLICRKPGAYLRAITHKERLAEVNVNVDSPVGGQADQETVEDEKHDASRFWEKDRAEVDATADFGEWVLPDRLLS